jgi:DNA-binding NarL/FixJ family response regulator
LSGARLTRILIADDHPLYRTGLRESLAGEDDFEVVAEAADGLSALKLAVEEEVDLAILDLLMPGLNGAQVARKLRKDRPELRVIIVSASGAEEHVREARAAGAAGYLLKSGAEAELAEACRAVIGGATVYPAGSAALLDGRELLTPRELEVLKLVAEGWSSRRIAEELVISVNTVDRHRQNLLEKLGAHDRVELTRYAIRRGLVEP